MRINFKIVTTKLFEADISYSKLVENRKKDGLMIDRDGVVTCPREFENLDAYDSKTEIKDIEVGQLTNKDKKAIFQQYLSDMSTGEFEAWKVAIDEIQDLDY